MDEKNFIPQANPKAGYLANKGEIDEAIGNALKSGWYILGKEVALFEKEFASYIGVPFGVGVANGTDALEIALRCSEIGPGDLVFTVSHTAVATIAAIERCGATPVLVDIDGETFTMSPEHLTRTIESIKRDKRAITGRPWAVIPVHLYGYPADMAAITDIASQYGLYVIEDCAQAHGASIDGQKVGSFGNGGAFSFYPTKNLGAVGDGGMVTTASRKWRDTLVSLRQYGWSERYVSSLPGINSRLDEIQAAVLRVQLRHLEEKNEGRIRIAGAYTRMLEDSAFQLPRGGDARVRHVYHQYVIRTEHRDLVREHLRENGIGSAIHYPVPVHGQPAYRGRIRTGPGGLIQTEKACREILSLPMYPELGDEEMCRIGDVLNAFSHSIRNKK